MPFERGRSRLFGCMRSSLWLAICCLTTLVVLYIVGAVSNGSLRHEVQTLPLWVPIIMGFRGHTLAKWSGITCLAIWLFLMLNIWSFLLGLPLLFSGHFSAVEIVLTVAVALASLCGITVGLRWRTGIRPIAAAMICVLFAGLQILALRVSFIPYIAHH